MNMTDLFVELIVVGSGVAIWIVLLLSTLFDVDWTTLLPDGASSFLVLIPSLSAVYVLGIIGDRAADWLFDLWDKPLRKERFKDSERYHEARTYVITHGTEEITNLFEYHRHRLRICRTWTLNFALLAITTPIFAWARLSRLDLATTGFVVLTLFSVTCWFTWRRLAVTDYKRLSEMYKFLLAGREDRSVAVEQ